MRNDFYHCNGIAEYDRANAGEFDGEEMTEDEREEAEEQARREAEAANAEAADWVKRGLWS